MFRHQGKNRTFKHNLRIATLLSFVAGIINVSGFLAIQHLTTNVTGHFALFINDFAHFKFWEGTVYLLYIISFLIGSFSSNFLIECFKEKTKFNVYTVPVSIEIFILIIVAFLYSNEIVTSTNFIACLLLFAMGLQNSYVTKISNAVVRTTHLTGLFTDLGIDLSQLLFPKRYTDRDKLMTNIKLRLFIIFGFFFGGLIGGFLFSEWKLKMDTLYIPALILAISLIYAPLKFSFLTHKRIKKPL
mgnify:CR=1 FL=1